LKIFQPIREYIIEHSVICHARILFLCHWADISRASCFYHVTPCLRRKWILFRQLNQMRWDCGMTNRISNNYWFLYISTSKTSNMVQLANDLGNHPWNLFWFNLLDLIGFLLSKFLNCLASSKFITLRIKNYYRITNGCKYEWSQPLIKKTFIKSRISSECRLQINSGIFQVNELFER
jgi:hypothetical protein